MSVSSRSYKEDLYASLRDDEEAQGYLQAALDDSRSAFLVALRNVVEARNWSKVARDSNVNRVHLYRTLSENGNPTLENLEKILHALRLRLAIQPEGAEQTQSAVTTAPWHIGASTAIKSHQVCYGSEIKYRTALLEHPQRVAIYDPLSETESEVPRSSTATEIEELCGMVA